VPSSSLGHFIPISSVPFCALRCPFGSLRFLCFVVLFQFPSIPFASRRRRFDCQTVFTAGSSLLLRGRRRSGASSALRLSLPLPLLSLPLGGCPCPRRSAHRLSLPLPLPSTALGAALSPSFSAVRLCRPLPLLSRALSAGLCRPPNAHCIRGRRRRRCGGVVCLCRPLPLPSLVLGAALTPSFSTVRLCRPLPVLLHALGAGLCRRPNVRCVRGRRQRRRGG